MSTENPEQAKKMEATGMHGTILVIEDDRSLQELIIRRLRRDGLNVHGVATGSEAFERIAELEPDLLILDYRLPNMTGDQFVRSLGTHGRSVPFIVITGHGDETVAVNMMQLGARDYVTKDSGFLDRLPHATRAALVQITTENELLDTQRALSASAVQFRAVVETAADAIISADCQGSIVYWNSAAESAFGLSVDEAVGRSVIGLMPERFRKAHQEGLERAASAAETRIIGNTVEVVGLRHDGSEFPVELALAKWKTDSDQFFTAIIRDITERKKMEEQLIVSDRLATIGELASGIAHELNNPLTSVIGFSELVMDKELPENVREHLEIIHREAKRTSGIVKNLLTFARKQAPTKGQVNIPQIIQTVLDLRAYEEKVSNIEVGTHFAPDLPEVMADGFQLQQVFLNIVLNAEQAMLSANGKGTLTITTERSGEMVRISFADDGPGISEENLGHIFDPFFTTKEVGKGTGLGLSICHGIVSEHNGRIYAESEVGNGTTFTVELPIGETGGGAGEMT